MTIINVLSSKKEKKIMILCQDKNHTCEIKLNKYETERLILDLSTSLRILKNKGYWNDEQYSYLNKLIKNKKDKL